MTENTDKIFISRLIELHHKILKLKSINKLFENGNIFFEFNSNDDKLALTSIIHNKGEQLDKNKLYTINKLF